MKTISQKALSLFLSLALLFGMAQMGGVPASAAVTGVTAYYCASGLYKDSGYTQKIDQSDKSYRSTVTDAVIEDGISTIGDGAFYNCTALKSVKIPDSVTAIGTFAFSFCYSLSDVTFSECSQLKTIGDYAFQCCNSLKTISLPSGVESIGVSVFFDCGLTDITITNDVKTVVNSAFNMCNLNNLYVVGDTLPTGFPLQQNVFLFRDTDSGYELTRYYGNQSGIIVPTELYGKPVTPPIDKSKLQSANVTAYCNGSLYKDSACTIPIAQNDSYRILITDIAFPNGVAAIDVGAFWNCIRLKSITIPKNISSVETRAFSGCWNLSEIKVDPDNPYFTAVNGALYSHDGKTLLGVPNGKNGEFAIPNSVSSIGAGAFSQCTSLTGVTIPSSVSSIANGTFQNCTSLASITIPTGVSSIGYSAFYGCTGLNTVVFKGNTTAVGNYAFDKTQSGSSITFYVPYGSTYSWKFDSVVMGNTKADFKTIPFVFDFNPPQSKTVPKGTALKDLNLPDSLEATVDGTKQTINGITWEPDRAYDPNTAGAYPFTAVLPDLYDTARALPKITVTVTGSNSPVNNPTPATPTIPTTVTNPVTGTTADLSGVALPSGVTGVSLNVTKKSPADQSDRQAADFNRALLANPKAGVIGNPVIYDMQLLDQNRKGISTTGKIQMTLPVPTGLRGTVHVLRYEPSGIFTDMGAKPANGMLVFETDRLGYFAVAGMGDSITLDTTSYAMPVSGHYEIGSRVTGTLAASFRVTSTNRKVAQVTKLKNGNYRVTGIGAGTAYMMYDVYDSKNRLLSHASVRIDVKAGVRPHGSSARQIGLF